MQAVILAAGKSSRFYPFNSLPHKSMLRVCGAPLILHTIARLRDAGIDDVVIVVSRGSKIPEMLGSGKDLGVALTYCEQQDALGQGDALLAARKFIHGSFFLLHGHRVDFAEFAPLLAEKQKDSDTMVLLAREEEDVSKYGVLKIAGDRVLDITEKPKKGEEPSHLRLIGIYLLPEKFWQSLSDTLPEHYSFEKALASYAQVEEVRVVVTKKLVPSLKYPWEALHLKDYLVQKLSSSRAESAEIAQNATISGNVYIADFVRIMEGARVIGPAYIGHGAVVGTNALIRQNSDVEDGAKVGAFCEMRNSLFGASSTIHSGFVGDSVIGEHVRIGAEFVTANKKIKRDSVKVTVGDEKKDTGMAGLGALIGDEVTIGVRVTVMPGIVIGRGSVIGPATTVISNVPENVTYYTKFSEVIEKKNDSEINLKEKASRRKVVLFDIDYTLFDTGRFKKSNLTTYATFEEILGCLLDVGSVAELGIFSEGEELFQKEKLLQTKIHEHFMREHTHIVKSKEETLEAILKKYQHTKLFLVDDKLEVLAKAKIYLPGVTTIWIKRGAYAARQKPIPGFTPDFTLETLEKLATIIANS